MPCEMGLKPKTFWAGFHSLSTCKKVFYIFLLEPVLSILLELNHRMEASHWLAYKVLLPVTKRLLRDHHTFYLKMNTNTVILGFSYWFISFLNLLTRNGNILNLPWNSSGAAYGGLPQNVSSLFPGMNSLLKPKSAILIFISLSSNRFSAFRSLCIIFFWWQYWTADTICNNDFGFT